MRLCRSLRLDPSATLTIVNPFDPPSLSVDYYPLAQTPPFSTHLTLAYTLSFTMTGTRKVTREVRYRRSMLSTGSILGCPPSPSPPPSGSESSDGDSSVSASARKPSARASSLETTPDPSDASMDCKSSDFGSTTGKFQRDCKAEEEEEEGKDADDEAEPGPDDLDEPWGYTFQVCVKVEPSL